MNISDNKTRMLVVHRMMDQTDPIRFGKLSYRPMMQKSLHIPIHRIESATIKEEVNVTTEILSESDKTFLMKTSSDLITSLCLTYQSESVDATINECVSQIQSHMKNPELILTIKKNLITQLKKKTCKEK